MNDADSADNRPEYRFPDSRSGLTRKIECGLDIYLTVNPLPDGSGPGEVFVKLGKQGTTVSGLMNALAVTISAALQRGVPWNELRDKFLDSTFEPRTDEYSSLVDAVAKNIDEMMQELREQLDDQTGQLHLFEEGGDNEPAADEGAA